MKSITTNHKQAGAVSIFVVIFATLLMAIITVGFIRLMISEQQKAAESDLSQSAYDSALTGVEDAKRAILLYQSACNNGAPNCAVLTNRLVSDQCNSGIRDIVLSNGSIADGVGGGTGEVMIQQSENDRSLDQAYTCVKVQVDSPNYEGSLAENGSVLVPLIGTGSFNEVTVEWFDSIDAGGTAVNLPAAGPNSRKMIAKADWPTNRPALLRAGLMQFGTNFTQDEFDTTKPNQSNANTVFLFPQRVGNAENDVIGLDPRYTNEATAGDLTTLDPKGLPVETKCETVVDGAAGPYACKMRLKLPDPIDGGDRTAYLRLSALYNKSNFRLTLSRDGTDVNFKGVQAVVDSTGRANDLFRRVESRIDLIDTTFPYPDAALDLGGNLCKNFGVDDEKYYADVNGSATCTP